MWLFDECPTQRRARGFHGWIYQAVDWKRLPDFTPPVPWLDRNRMPLPEDYPRDSWCLTGGPLPDLWQAQGHGGCHFIVSAALRAVLRLPAETAQFRPIALFTHDPAAAAKGYCLMRLLAGAPAMDRALSDFEEQSFVSHQTGVPDQFIAVRRFVLSRDITPPAELFWAEEKPDLVIATEALAERVQAAGLSSVIFGDPWDTDDFGSPRMRRTPGGQIPIAPPRIGVRPVRDSALQPAYVPSPGLEPEFLAIEAVIGQQLPEAYVAFLRDPPAALRDVAARLASFEVMELAIDPGVVLTLNRQVREDPDVQFLAGEAGWPADWLVVGEDGCGNYTILDLGCDASPVLHYDHEFVAAEVVAMNLEAQADTVVREWFAAEANVDVRAARRGAAPGGG